jgi:ketol-acid reductoisomerase
MVNALYDRDADLSLLNGKKVAVVGYGIQGRAQALNLRDSGVDVLVGLKKNGESWKAAEEDGFKPHVIREAVKLADIIMLLIPDEVQADVYMNDIAVNLKKGKVLEFAHGFSIHFHRIEPPDGVDVIMVAPKGPGAMVRNTFLEGFGTPALVAVERDFSGKALGIALAIAKGIGATRAGVIMTTFREETETDNFGEQVVLCGGVAELIGKAFKLLVSEGYQPEVAYFEVLHELKLIVDLIQKGGIENMWDNVSNTAEYGGRTRGSRIIDDHAVQSMREILNDIRSGSFAEEWMKEYYSEMPTLRRLREEAKQEQIENVGRELRSLFLRKERN